MTVYVDNKKMPYRRMYMCHMCADSHEELLGMANRIGVNAKWLQKAGTYMEHFDICLAKKNSAIKNGAIEITAKKTMKLMLRKKANA